MLKNLLKNSFENSLRNSLENLPEIPNLNQPIPSRKFRWKRFVLNLMASNEVLCIPLESSNWSEDGLLQISKRRKQRKGKPQAPLFEVAGERQTPQSTTELSHLVSHESARSHEMIAMVCKGVHYRRREGKAVNEPGMSRELAENKLLASRESHRNDSGCKVKARKV